MASANQDNWCLCVCVCMHTLSGSCFYVWVEDWEWDSLSGGKASARVVWMLAAAETLMGQKAAWNSMTNKRMAARWLLLCWLDNAQRTGPHLPFSSKDFGEGGGVGNLTHLRCATQYYEGHYPSGFSFLPGGPTTSTIPGVASLVGQKIRLDGGPHRTGLDTPARHDYIIVV